MIKNVKVGHEGKFTSQLQFRILASFSIQQQGYCRLFNIIEEILLGELIDLLLKVASKRKGILRAVTFPSKVCLWLSMKKAVYFITLNIHNFVISQLSGKKSHILLVIENQRTRNIDQKSCF